MGRLLQRVVLAMATILLVASCMSSEDKDVPVKGNTCYISSVKFNSLRREITVKANDGVTDSTYFSSFVATKWVFTIDHRNLTIENRDSLPYKTDVSRCLMNMSYQGAIAYYRASDAWEDDPWLPYSSTDSIDLRKPIYIRVVAPDRTERKYMLRANVHTMHGDSLRWTTVTPEQAISGTHPMKAMGWDERMAVMVNDGNAVLWLTHANSNQGEWSKQVTDLPTTVDVASLSCYDGKGQMFVNTTDGSLYTSTDGVAWSLASQKEGLRLVGVSQDRVYIMAEGQLHSASPSDMIWTEEKKDEQATLFPDEEISFLTYSDKENVTRMLFLGNRSVQEDTTAVVWGKSWTAFESESKETWMHFNRNWDNTRQLPMLSHLNVHYYDNKLMALGGKSRNGKVEAMERFYVSEDNGLTWWRLTDIVPPTSLLKVTGNITSAVDSNKFLWIIAGGKVFRGRLNKLGFARPDIE